VRADGRACALANASTDCTMTTTLTSSWWSVSYQNGDCDIVGSDYNCVSTGTLYQSSTLPTGYQNNAACTITAQRSLYFRTVAFSTASGDQLLFEEYVYEDYNGPNGVMSAGGVMTWSSDASGTSNGWTLCAYPSPPPLPPPGKPPLPPEPTPPPPQSPPPTSFLASVTGLALYLPAAAVLLGGLVVARARCRARATGQSTGQILRTYTKRRKPPPSAPASTAMPGSTVPVVTATAISEHPMGVPMAVPVVQAQMGGGNVAEELTRLSHLRASGDLSAAEFELAKARVLGSV